MNKYSTFLNFKNCNLLFELNLPANDGIENLRFY